VDCRGNQNFHFELDLDEASKRLFRGEANAGVAFQIGQLRYIPVLYWYIPVHTKTYCVVLDCTYLYLYLFFRVGEGTVPLAIVLYIDGSFVKHKIPVKPIYVSVRNLNSTVSGKACAWRVLGMMMPSLKKSATLDQTDMWRTERRLRLHHSCIAHVVEIVVNKFGSEDKHLLCADGQVHTSTYQYILVHTCLYLYELTCTDLYCPKVSLSGGDCSLEKC